MPWQEVSIMDQRAEFVVLARQGGTTRGELCRRFRISRETGNKWFKRAAGGDADWAEDRSRRPRSSPNQTEAAIEAAVLAVRDEHPAWGARKILACLERDGVDAPARSTIHEILVRHGRVVPPVRAATHCRFEHPEPNLVWQMDFKGRFALRDRERWCHALTMVDDHSRYALCLAACANEQGSTVRGQLERVFRCYGLPHALLVDNGTPWGTGSERRWTKLGVWLLKHDVDVIHSRPYHPQTRGKNERFHRTLKAEVLAMQSFRALRDVQVAFDRWRQVYNQQRPHEALGQAVPASRYRSSPRSMPSKLPEPEYLRSDIVRTVGSTRCHISFKGRAWQMPEAFAGERVAVRPLDTDGRYGVFFGSRQIARLDLRDVQQ